MLQQKTNSQVPEISGQDVLDKVEELRRYGFGRLEVIVRDGQITGVNKTESLVKKG